MNELKKSAQIDCVKLKGVSVTKVIKVQLIAKMNTGAGHKLLELYCDMNGNELFCVDPED